MTVDFGVDLSCISDLTEEMREVTGPMVLVERLLRRWSTPRGMIIDDEDAGTDLTEFLNEELDDTGLERMVAEAKAEAEKEEAIRSCVATEKSFNATENTVRMVFAIDTGEDPLRLTIKVSELGVELLEVS